MPGPPPGFWVICDAGVGGVGADLLAVDLVEDVDAAGGGVGVVVVVAAVDAAAVVEAGVVEDAASLALALVLDFVLVVVSVAAVVEEAASLALAFVLDFVLVVVSVAGFIAVLDADAASADLSSQSFTP